MRSVVTKVYIPNHDLPVFHIFQTIEYRQVMYETFWQPLPGSILVYDDFEGIGVVVNDTEDYLEIYDTRLCAPPDGEDLKIYNKYKRV